MRRILMLSLLVVSTACWASDYNYGIKEKISMPKNVCNTQVCWATYFHASPNVFLSGGVCSDDPIFVTQVKDKNTEGQVFNDDGYVFSDECKTQERDQSLFDAPPTYFTCRFSDSRILSGASYKKIENIQVKSMDKSRVDDRVYIYECVKNCEHAPSRVMHIVGDCG